MQVKNQVYYHVHRINEHSNKWSVGTTYDATRKELNLFNSFYDNHSLQTQIVTGQPQYLLQSISSYNNLSQPQRVNIIDRYLGEFIEALKEHCKFIREVIFEEVRQNYFPQLPSRRTCIWLCEQDAVSYWWNQLGNNTKKILKLQVTGTIHEADQRHLNQDTYSHDIFRRNAFNYWTGTDNLNNIEKEILFEGLIDIIEEYADLETFNNRMV